MNTTKHAIQQFPKTYDYVKEIDILDIPDVYTPISTLETPNREVGVYEFKMSMTYRFTSANTSVFYRWRTNGGVWNVTTAEPKDKTDDQPKDYYYPVEHKGGAYKVEVEMKKETSSGVPDVHFHDMVFERKG